MNLCELTSEIPLEFVEAVDNILLESAMSNWMVREDAVGKRAWIISIAEDQATAIAQWHSLELVLAAAGVPVVAPAVRPLGDADWRDSYKAHFKAWRFGRLHWVPVWERDRFRVPTGDAVLWLDPGLAFGTGNHETTRLCVERLVEATEEYGPRGRVIDAGCGSGILALSAALLGFQDIRGFDNDSEAVRVSEANAAVNGLSGRVQFRIDDLTNGLAGETGRAGVVMANIQADVLMRFARPLVDAVAPAGILVLSGILAVESGQVRDTFATLRPGWRADTRVMGEWSDLSLVRPA